VGWRGHVKRCVAVGPWMWVGVQVKQGMVEALHALLILQEPAKVAMCSCILVLIRSVGASASAGAALLLCGCGCWCPLC